MKIEIKLKNNKKLFILSDNLNLIIADDIAEIEKDGTVTEKIIKPSYYSSLDHLFEGLINKTLLRSDAETLNELRSELKHTLKTIRSIFNINDLKNK